MFVPLRGTPTWRFQTELYEFQSNVSANNTTKEYRTDLRLGEVVYLLFFYSVTNSCLLSLNGFDFNILWRDSENREGNIAERNQREQEKGTSSKQMNHLHHQFLNEPLVNAPSFLICDIKWSNQACDMKKT